MGRGLQVHVILLVQKCPSPHPSPCEGHPGHLFVLKEDLTSGSWDSSGLPKVIQSPCAELSLAQCQEHSNCSISARCPFALLMVCVSLGA